jgi:hypothetical protein
MKIRGKILLLSVLVVASPQLTMAQTVSKLRKLPKDTLVEMAVKKIRDTSFDKKDFTAIEVWAEDDDISVKFDHAIKFVPMKGQFYYRVSVDLMGGSVNRLILGKGSNDEDVQFYKPKEFDKEIKFIFQAINDSKGEIGKTPEGQLPDGAMVIMEHLAYYDITVDSHSTHSYYKIRKGTGQVYDAGHKHYARESKPPPGRERIY